MGISLKAVSELKCPRCREGHMFVNPTDFSKPLNMQDKCEICGQKMLPEPGFYFGAMFLSYIISSWMLLLPALALIFYFDWSVLGAIGFTVLIAALTYLPFLRGSRALWLHMMVKYDPSAKAKHQVQN